MNAPTTTTDPPVGTAARPEEAAIELKLDDGCLHVHASGTWSLSLPRPALDEFLTRIRERPRCARFSAEVDSWDSGLLTWLRRAIRSAQEQEIEIDRSGLPHGIAELLELAEIVVEPPRDAEPGPAGFFAKIGRRAAELGHEAVESVGFLGRVAASLGRLVLLRAHFRRADFFRLLQSTGAEAVPIVTLVSVVVGLILAFVGSIQLRQFGADVYIANLVGIAVVREMGAMVVGVIMAGRTGAAFAAQLGTMKVTEEIDALRTFGISPIDFLVLPRVVALAVMTPFLCLYSSLLGICGGALVGVYLLNISPQLYLDQTLDALTLSDLYLGIFRGTVYGVLIGITSCLRGMRCGSDAAAVGEATTSAVVTALVAIVLADGVMAVVFHTLGI